MKLSSPAFAHNGKIPSKYTCDGENISPSLDIQDVPAGTKALVLLVEDPDIPQMAKDKYNIYEWDHWVVYNIPALTTHIAEGTNPIGLLGRSTHGKNAYGGPCPPDREHRYFFKLYALDHMLPLEAGATKDRVARAMQGHILEEARLVCRYGRVSKK